MGIGFARAKVGDRYVLEVMQERGWLFGGEGSGHLLCSGQAHDRRRHRFRIAGTVRLEALRQDAWPQCTEDVHAVSANA